MMNTAANKSIEKQPFERIETLLIDAFDEMKKADHGGIHTGIDGIDQIVGELQGGEVIVLASRPGVGKTALALNIARGAAQLGTGVAYLSLEMSARQLGKRILSAEARVSMEKIGASRMPAADWIELMSAADRLSKLELWLGGVAGATAAEACGKARELLGQMEPGKRLFIFDCLQLIEAQGPHLRSRYEEIARAMRSLKALAGEMDAPVIVVSQLSRAVESRACKRPVLSDLSESDAIGQIADVVILLDRSLSVWEADCEGRPDFGIADVIVAKNRNGRTDYAVFAYENSYGRFSTLRRIDD